MATGIVVNNREPWLDNVKMVAMLLVIAIHTIGHCGDMQTWGYGAVAEWINSFNMQMFTLLAGYTSWRGLNRIDSLASLCEYGEKIFWRMVLPAVFFSAIPQIEKHLLFARKLWVIFAIVSVISYELVRLYAIKPKSFVLFTRIATMAFLLVSSLWLNMYWFIAMLMKLQCIGAMAFFVVKGKLQNRSPWLYVIPLILLLYIPAFLWLDSWTIEMCPFFIIGLISSAFRVAPQNNKTSVSLFIVFALIGLVLLRLLFGYSFYNKSLDWFISEGQMSLYFVRFGCALSMSLSVICLTCLFSKRYNLFSKMGSYSLSFYLIQEILLTYIVYPYINISGNALLMWILWGLFMTVFTMLMFGIIRLFDSNLVSRRLLLGK